MKKWYLSLLLLVSSQALAEISVIVHPSNNGTVDAEIVSRVFLGKAKSLSSGESVTPFNMTDSSELYDEFTEKALGKSASQVKAYWAKLIFTGKGNAPKQASSEQEMLKTVSSDPSAIGYVSSSAVDDSVKVVLTF